jgi:hypothetical protein
VNAALSGEGLTQRGAPWKVTGPAVVKEEVETGRSTTWPTDDFGDVADARLRSPAMTSSTRA